MSNKPKRRRIKFEKRTNALYGQIWRLTEGAIYECFKAHPEYLANNVHRRSVHNSIVKRVTGEITGWIEQRSRQRRSGASSAADTSSVPARDG
ncbi:MULTISPECIES: hypothetical protein [Methylobacterium]|jgi:hypothetical protein|uniref:hypothetical protein n=1 Tax=Methylobacterium TaxID=407 RepID=UPI000EDC1083|nr:MULTISPECIES: hypothetical protein [Methylobacterium]GBU16819.1 hypothetical protein AwMethylo_10340 [Methylobacterium sp.]